MRNLSPHALSVFSQSGIEPVLLIRVFWNGGNGIIYSDRKFEQYGFQGKLISVGILDDIVNIDNSSNSAQVDITLDDTDGALKQIFNTSDIHKTKVQLLQWCTDLAPDEAFPIFTGQISSPIEWKEGDRTLSFEAVTLIEDREVGFSIEDGNFTLFPSKLIGKSWPIIFGKVVGLPALQILEAPSGILGQGIGIVDDTVWENELGDLEAQRQIALQNAKIAFQNGVAEANIASKYKGSFLSFLVDDPSNAESHDQAADSYYAQSAAFTDDANNISREIALKNELRSLQKSYDRGVFRINSVNMPTGTLLRFKLGTATYTGIYANGFFQVVSKQFPEDFNKRPAVNFVGQGETPNNIRTSDIFGNAPQQKEFGQKFLWVDAGTEIHVDNFPLTFVVSVGAVFVKGVYSYRRGVRSILPSNYYTVSYQQFGNSICTLITLAMPLTARTFDNGINTIPEGWDSDSIEVDSESIIGPNTVDILIWIITLFTDFGFDNSSFQVARFYLDNYPMNFAITSKKNVVNLLQEIAYQARCSLWLNDGIFYIRYLPVPPAPVETITDADIVMNSLVVTCTDTENIVTNYVATWRPNLFQDDFRIIYKYNIPRYGFKTGGYDYYAYNQENLVRKSAEFWLIRNSNTYKILRFKTTLHKLNIETFDPILINLEPGLVSNSPVVGTVLKATYNTGDKTIDIDVWLPIRFGEMDVYPFAEPFGISTVYPVLNDPNIKSENPFELAGILPQEQFILEQQSPFQHYLGLGPPAYGRYQSIGDAFDSFPPDPIGFNISGLPIDPSRIGGLPSTNSYLKYRVNNIETPVVTDPTNAGFPGIIQSTSDKAAQKYNVDVYFNGFSNNPTSTIVKQFVIHPDDEISPGTPVEVKRLVYRDSNGLVQTVMWMQAPVWQPTSEDSDTGGGFSGGGDFDSPSSPSPEEDTGSGGLDGPNGDVTDEGFPEPVQGEEE